MSQIIPIVNLTPIVVTQPTLPNPEDELADLFEIYSEYNTSKKVLNSSVNGLIPVEVNIESVVVQQFYDARVPNELQFYFVYDLGGSTSGDFQEVTYTFAASNSDGKGGEIDLSTIENVFTLLVDDDPKTSRGTTTTVRQSQSEE